MTEESVEVVIPEPNFTLFNGTRDELPEVIVVNGALLAFKHTEIFAWHLEVTLHAVDLADQGMPTPEESKLLFGISDKIEQTIVGYNTIFLARSTWSGFRQIAFRVYDPEVANTKLQELLENENARFWEFEMKYDPDWHQAGFYFQLFPLATGENS